LLFRKILNNFAKIIKIIKFNEMKYDKRNPKKLRFGIRLNGLEKIRLHQLALKADMSDSELIRSYIRENYANYGRK
jgi:hypothetical protein